MKNITQCLFVVILFISANSYASLKKIVKEAVGSNQVLKINKLEVQSSQLESQKIEAVNSWTFGADISHFDQFRDAIFSFQSLRTIGQALNLSLEKKFSWGGSIKIEQGLVNYDLTNFSGAGAGLTDPSFDPRPVEYISRISFSKDLSKDFFGKYQKLDKEVVEVNIKLREKEVLAQEEELLGQLVTLYTQASYYKSLMQTTQGNIKRYKKRKKLVSKRVQDGLRLEVDSLQVESAYLDQKNQLSNLEDEFEKIIEKISLVLERNYNGKEVILMENSFKGNHPDWVKWELGQNIELEKAQAQLKQIEILVEKTKRELLPSVVFNASLGTNAIEPTLGRAFEDGNISSNFKDQSVGLNVVIPLGRKLTKANLAQSKIQHAQQETRINILKKGIEIQFNSMKNRIKLTVKKIQGQKERLVLLEKIRARYDKLYSQGRVDIDVILNAEDSYSQAQTQLFQSLLSYELLFWEMSVLSGHVKEYFEFYKESV